MYTAPPKSFHDAESELFRLLIENVKDCAIFAVDPQGQVLIWNGGAERLLGYREDEIVGQSFANFFTPEDIRAGMPQQELGESLKVRTVRDDRWHVCKDGSRLWCSSTTEPLRDAIGNVRGFAKVIRDRTAWKLAEEERSVQMKEAERRRRLYEAALSNTPDLVYVFDLDHRFTYANEGLLAMWGRTWDEAIGKNCLELGYEPWHAAMHDREIEQVVAAKAPIKGEVPFTGTFGRRIYEYIFVPVIDEHGQVEAVAGTTRDVTERRQSEELVRHSEERFRSLMEQAPFSIQLFSPDGRTIRVNRAWEELWGVRFEQIAEYNILEDRQLEAHGVLGLIRQGFAGQPARIPAIQYNPNDAIPDVTTLEDPYRWLSAVIYPLKDADGRVREVALIHEDITARKRAEDALLDAHRDLEHRVAERTAELLRTNEFLNALLENVQTGIVACDAAGVLNLFNSVTRELHGLAEEAVPPEQWAERYGLYQPDGKTPMAKEDVPLFRALQGERVRDAEMVLAPPGVPPRTVLASGQAFYDARGVKLGAVVSMHDITDRKRAEADLRKAHEELERRVEQRTEELRRANAALRESEEKLRLLADTIPQLAWMARSDGHIFWYNRRWYEYTGTTPEQMEGWGWQSVHDPQVLPRVMERWQRSIASGESFDMVFPLKGADGEFRPFLTRIIPLRDATGRILYWFGTNTDISDLKRMEEALRDADRRKDEFLATLAHELRNPLAPIRNSLQILKMPRVDAATAQQTRDMMERQVTHLVRLVDDLLDVSRVMRGKIELRKEPIELATVIARAVETVQPLIEVQGHALEISVPNESLVLNADPVRLAQIIGNLLTNAAKYTEAGGHIWLEAHREGSEAVLSVRDDGIGIAPDMLPHVFELFVQVDHATTRSQGGLGIGLTLVKNLVELHGGAVQARSAGLGQGAEFIVRLPLAARESRQPAEEHGAQTQPAPATGYRLLVVDDNQDAATSLALLLRLQGHDVQVAHDGLSALEVAKSYRPALVFLDLGMPGMDGYQVARQMRKTPGLQNTVLAALTGWGQQEDRRRTAEAGFDYHLVKPPEPQALASLLAELNKSAT